MSEYVYFIRNGDLYNIGRTKDIDRARKSFAPCVIEASMLSEEAEEIVLLIHKTYEEKRLPQSNYFRLSKSEAQDCRQKLISSSGKDNFKPFFSGYKVFIAFIFFWFLLSYSLIKFGINPIFEKLSS